MFLRALALKGDGMVSYGKFRNFLILLPEAKLSGMDPSAIWFEAAAVVPFGKAITQTPWADPN